MPNTFPVWVGSTWENRYEHQDLILHFRMYGTGRNKALKDSRVFDGMDGVTINDNPSTQVSGCWVDIKSQPQIIKGLVGPRGLAFLTIVDQKRIKTTFINTPVKGKKKKIETLFTQLRVISAWQFSIVATTNKGTEAKKAILSALKKYFGKSPNEREWVLE